MTDTVQSLLFLLQLVCSTSCSALAEAQFTVSPQSVVQAEGLEAVFECLYNFEALHHGWGINGEFLSDTQFPPGLTRIPPSSGGSPARLVIPATPQYNNTVVQCRAIVEGGGGLLSVRSENATLKVQGPLHSVTNLKYAFEQSSNTTITIAWTPPFSLNLTTAKPDIQYCVDVYNVTGDDHLQSVCDITDTSYTFPADDPDQLFNFTVTPRSNVEGSLNGTTSQPVQGYLLTAPPQINITRDDVDVGSIPIQVTIPGNYLEYPRRVPTEYIIEISCFPDLLNSCLAIPSVSDEMIEFNVPCVSKHQICNLTFTAKNDVGITKYTSHLENISTYHVQNATAEYSDEQFLVECKFLVGTRDPGCLIIVSSSQNSLLEYRALRFTNSETTNVIIPGNFSTVSFDPPMVYVYDLRQDTGAPEKWPAVRVSSEFSPTLQSTGTPNITDTPRKTQSAEAFSLKGHICLSCSFSAADGLTGCVGVIHSAQLEDLTLTVLTVERSGGVNCTRNNMTEGSYYVAVFGMLLHGLEESPAYWSIIRITSTRVSPTGEGSNTDDPVLPAAFGSTVMTVVVIVVAMVVVIVLRGLYHKKRKSIILQGPPPPPLSIPVESPEFEAATKNKTTPSLKSSMTSESFSSTHSLPEPAYDVVNKVTGRQVTFNAPRHDSTQTEVQEKVNQVTGMQYAHVGVRNKSTLDTDPPPEDPTKVQYASIDKKKLAPATSDSQKTRKAPPPSSPPPPTAETVLSELHPIARRWEELGEALGLPESLLDNISMEGSDQVRLHDMIYHYFGISRPHAWEELVRALTEIGETEAADKIVRTKGAKVSLATVKSTAPPPLPPRNLQQKQTEQHHDNDEHDDLEMYTSNIEIAQHSTQEKPSKEGEETRKTQSGPDVTVPLVQMSSAGFQRETDATTLITISYWTLVLHSLGIYEKFDAPMKHKLRALCYYNTVRHGNVEVVYQRRMEEDSDICSSAEIEDVYQKKMLELSKEEELFETEQNCSVEKLKEPTKYSGLTMSRVVRASEIQKAFCSAVCTGEITVCNALPALSVWKIDKIQEKYSARRIQTVKAKLYTTSSVCCLTVSSEKDTSICTCDVVAGSIKAAKQPFNTTEKSIGEVNGKSLCGKPTLAPTGDTNFTKRERSCNNGKVGQGHFFCFAFDKVVKCLPKSKPKFSGIHSQKHGCIFQPAGEDTCHLDCVGVSVESQTRSTACVVWIFTLRKILTCGGTLSGTEKACVLDVPDLALRGSPVASNHEFKHTDDLCSGWRSQHIVIVGTLIPR